MGTPVHIGSGRVEHAEATRVSADVDGSVVWFESKDIELSAVPEVWASAFLIPALEAGRPLEVADPLDSVWQHNVGRMLPVLRRWWRYPLLEPRAGSTARLDSTRPAPRPAPDMMASGMRTGVFFTCGVDSFHALLHSGHEVGAVVNVHGFDVALDDVAHQSDLESSIQVVAGTLGIEPIVVRTNLRDHPLMRAVSWERSHGGALAGVGHALTRHVDRLLIASSFPTRPGGRWGSHWRIDPLWTSSAVEFVHVGGGDERLDKIRALADEPLLRPHLRVCFKRRAGQDNCCRCEKCLFTMLALRESGVLDFYPLFEEKDQLLERLRNIPRFRWRTRGLRRLARSRRLDPEHRRAAGKLYLRSKWALSPPRRAAVWLLERLGLR